MSRCIRNANINNSHCRGYTCILADMSIEAGAQGGDVHPKVTP